MCGIVGYIGGGKALPVLLEGLKRLEYRGYDSAGVALIKDGRLVVKKKAGKVSDLEHLLQGQDLDSGLGIGHTRWATHGEPSDLNAHPHVDCSGTIALIHNGIIENYATIKKKLIQDGHVIKTATDTEVLVHLIEEMLKKTGDLCTAVRYALLEVEGTFGILVISQKEPDKIIAARRGSPIVIGLGEGQNYIASDASALVEHTRQVVYLNDDEIACITKEACTIKTIRDQEVVKQVEQITLSLAQIEKGGYDHFMLKEIYEQPESILNCLRGRLRVEEGNAHLGGLLPVMDRLVNAKRIIITACGTSWHAALAGKYMLEQMARIPVEVDYASEFRYRSPVIGPEDALFVISQSGETADT
ncbi:MAG: glutamine--fructose-6-phosphate transaminase (isomerizing), partial [bacterium]|nr:glutamine--fructose-6-phosphate transaminase (isomerizing) [bacterium]